VFYKSVHTQGVINTISLFSFYMYRKVHLRMA